MNLQFADNLKVIMKTFNLKQQKMAELLGTVNQRTISSYANGEIPNTETLIRLREVTGLSIDTLVFSKIEVNDLPARPLREPISIKDQKYVSEPAIKYENTLEERVVELERWRKEVEMEWK